MMYILTCKVVPMVRCHPCHVTWRSVGIGSGQGSTRSWCCRLPFLLTTHPHPLTVSPYAQILARGIASALGWIRRPHRGRESRGGHGRGWPATQLPAQVSTGPHAHLLLPPPAHSLHGEDSPPPPPSQIEQWQILWRKLTFSLRHNLS